MKYFFVSYVKGNLNHPFTASQIENRMLYFEESEIKYDSSFEELIKRELIAYYDDSGVAIISICPL